jgi:hypothetical protein
MGSDDNISGRPVKQAIRDADDMLPGTPSAEGDIDPRWQAIMRVGEYIESDPADVWPFILRWGKHANEDLRMAIATCLLEHLLEYHFEDYFPLVKAATKESKRFASTFRMSGQFGQAKRDKNTEAFNALRKELGI